MPIGEVSKKALELLTSFDWPGNVRQLRNVIRCACILTQHEKIQPQDLAHLEESPLLPDALTGRTLEEVERHVILTTLREFGGNKTAAAEQLGVTPRTLLNKMKKYREQ